MKIVYFFIFLLGFSLIVGSMSYKYYADNESYYKYAIMLKNNYSHLDRWDTWSNYSRFKQIEIQALENLKYQDTLKDLIYFNIMLCIISLIGLIIYRRDLRGLESNWVLWAILFILALIISV